MPREKALKIVIYRKDEVDGELLESFIKAVTGKTEFYEYRNGRFVKVDRES